VISTPPSDTAGLAEQAASVTSADVPPAVRTVIRQAVLDTLGVTLAGAGEPVTRILVTACTGQLGPGPASLLDGSGRGTSAETAALINGTAAHALDFDDMHPAMLGHPSAPLVPAVLALAEELGSSGSEVVTALAAGYEVQARVGIAVTSSHYARGFHPTGTVATLGVAAAAARLLGLDATDTEVALGLAATQASGLKSMFGTMAKPLHAGRAAASGIFAARLAGGGFTAALDVLGRPQGLAAATSDGFDPAPLRVPFAAEWHTLGIVAKVHAACGFTHSVIEALLQLREKVAVDAIRRVRLLVHPELLGAADIRHPTTPLEAKFSVRLVAALALIRGTVSVADFGAGVVSDPVVAGLAERVEVEADGSGRLTRLASVCTIETDNGERLVAEHDAARPLWVVSPDEQAGRLTNKFIGLAGAVLGAARADAIAQMVDELEMMADVRPLVRLAAGQPD
jgi:2-methylcitrate dehydratase PrpD